MHVLLWGGVEESFLETQKHKFPLRFPWLTWILKDCWPYRDLQTSTQKEHRLYASPELIVTICSLSLWESTQIDSPGLVYFQGHLCDPSSHHLTPPPFVHLLVQLCELGCICLKTPCPGKLLQKKITGKNISAFEATQGFKSPPTYRALGFKCLFSFDSGRLSCILNGSS